MVKRAALYLRVSTLDQKPSTRLYDLRGLAEQRGFEIVHEYSDHGFSGARVRRPALDEMLVDARRGQFDVVVVWACDRRARSARHFLEVLDELSHLNIKFVSFREQLDTGGPPGCAVIITIISAVAELERSLIIERIRAGMRRAKLEGRHIGPQATQHRSGRSAARTCSWPEPDRNREDPPDVTGNSQPLAEAGKGGL